MRTPRRTFLLLGATLLLALASVGLLAGAASAQSPAPDFEIPEVKDGKVVQLGCPECHGDPDIESKGKGLYVPESRVDASLHGDLECIECHLQTQGVLHADPEAELEAARTSCQDCHEDAWADWSGGSHADAEGAPICSDCHTPHDVTDPEARDFVIEAANELCADCHTEKGQDFFRNNYHGKEANLGREDIAVCADCHGPHRVLPMSDPDSTISDANRTATCAACHPGAGENFADIQIHVDADPIPSDPKLAAATLYFIIVLTATFGLFGWHMVLGVRHEFRQAQERANGTDTEQEDE